MIKETIGGNQDQQSINKLLDKCEKLVKKGSSYFAEKNNFMVIILFLQHIKSCKIATNRFRHLFTK